MFRGKRSGAYTVLKIIQTPVFYLKNRSVPKAGNMVQRSKSASSEPSQRQLRVGEDLRHHLAAILMRQETHIPELDKVSITVSEVSVSPDLSSARVYVMTLGGQDMDAVLPILNQYAPVLRHEVAKRVHLRRLPVFKFVRDDSYDNADRMARLFSGIKSQE